VRPDRARSPKAPSLATLARGVLKRAGVSRGDGVLVACSGGVDSQVLLDVLVHVAVGSGLAIFAHGVDHGLRPEAAAELDLVESCCRARGVPFERTRVAVARGPNLAARARAARYEALEAARRRLGAAWLATAHHLDDRAETVLIRLLRGAPLRALGVLPESSGALLRPLVAARRSWILAHAARRGVPFAEDPSNADRRPLRGRVRHDLLPRLREVDPRIEEHLAAWAEQALALPTGPDPLGAAPGTDALEVLANLRRSGRLPSGRALDALRDAARAKNREARVLLPGGRVARWDEARGIVITPETQTGERTR
jgi:tRNA(Ile)-lysidine synthase